MTLVTPLNGDILLSSSVIDPRTIQGYLETHYCVAGPIPFELRVGIVNDSLATIYKQTQTDCGTYITGCNPFSQVVGETINNQKQAKLAKELRKRGLTFIDGIGKHPTGNWLREPSYLVLGFSLEEAKALGKEYEQNAIVWCGSDAIPQLILLR